MHLKYIVSPLLVLALLAGCASSAKRPTPQTEIDFGVLSGTWQGSFQASSPTPRGPPVASSINLRLVFRDGRARVFTKEGGTWNEIEPENFAVEILGTNALVYLLHAGRIPKPQGSRWFETYLIAATAKTDRELLVRWTRVVNNLDTSPDDADRAFTVDGEGLLEKVEAGGG